MQKDRMIAYIREQYGVDPDIPWSDDTGAPVVRRQDNRKWFGIFIQVQGAKVGLTTDETVDVLNVKCDEILIDVLRDQSGYHSAYHMNKRHWISILLDETVKDDDVRMLIDMSYKLTGPRSKKKR